MREQYAPPHRSPTTFQFGAKPTPSFGGQGTMNTAAVPEQKDIEVANPPSDGISGLSFSPQAEFLAASSWDNNVRVYGIEPNGTTSPKAMYSHEGPVLGVCWSKDGTKILSGGADKAGRMYDVQTGQPQQVAQHDAPIRAVRWVDSNNGILATGSWDKTVKYWDLRAPNPVATVQLPERCYTMDVVFPLMVVGTAERHIQVFNLNNPTTAYKSLQSPLKWQTRVVSCFANASGFAVGSIEGRVAIQYVEEKDTSNNFSFKCHRKDPGAGQARGDAQLFAVNDISFHMQHGTFSTAGSDGTINFWDKDSKTRLKTFDNKGGPISATAFNRNGTIFAYAVSYDWHKGYSFANPQTPNQIFLHATKDDEIKRRPKK